MKAIVLAMLVTVTTPLPAKGMKSLTNSQVSKIVRLVTMIDIEGTYGKSSEAIEVASLVNARFKQIVEPVKLIKDKERLSFYAQGMYETAISQLYNEGVLVSKLIAVASSKSSEAEEVAASAVASLVNDRLEKLVNPVVLSKPLTSYAQEMYETAISQLYNEGVLTPQLIEPLLSIEPTE